MNYIVLDLEWNQSSTGGKNESSDLLFEIVEIGAVKLNDRYVMVDEFSCLVRPKVYHEMNRVTGRLIHLQMQELERGKSFAEAAEDFLRWCGSEEYIFCTWGGLDLTELQRNMEYYKMKPLSDGPIAFLDVQKLFSIVFEDGKSRRALEYAVDLLRIEKDIPFHRAFGDAYYTAKILQVIGGQHPEAQKNLSYDVFHPPLSREKEVKIRFDNYVKYISREFADKAAAFADREVSSSKCYLCNRNLRKKLKWFTPNGRHYYCLAYCEKHGYLKGKIRIRKTDRGTIYIVKTTKLIDGAEADEILQRMQKTLEMRKKRQGGY
ncbi:MAG: exonuclease domain-containing protein [bacterium]|nr:exonuclease domain-containing protein [bacterium]